MRVLAFFLLLFSHTVMGQWYVGGNVGVSFSNFKSKSPWKEVSNSSMTISVSAFKQVRPNTGLTVKLEYLQKGYYHKVCNTIYDKLEANYLEMPVMIDYNFIIPSLNNWKAHAGLGFYGAYWLTGKYKTRGFDSGDDRFDFKKQRYKRFDMGPGVMARIEYILKNGSVSLDSRYEIGLMDMQKGRNNNVANTNRTFVLGFTYMKYMQRN
jgi:hypothetical protein